MARTISTASQTLLDQNLGTEPALIIEIQWVDGGSINTYSDKDLGGNEGKILDVSGLDNTVVVQGVKAGTSGDSQQISVTLDDTDGSIKNIMDTHDIHKEQAWVYQWFQGLDQNDKFLIFKGQISSPIQWNEGDRTVSFDIITRIEDAEVGFSMEEGNFEFVPEDLIGQSWPLVFGTVITCPALKTRSPRKGLLKTPFGIRDYMLAPKKEQASKVCCPWVFVGFRSYYDPNSGGAWGSGNLNIRPVYEKDVSCQCKRLAIQCEMDLNIASQAAWEFSTIEIIDGDLFPQGVYLTLNINGARIGGTFAGTASSPSTTFNIAGRQHPKFVAQDPAIPPIKSFGCDDPPTGQENDPNQGTGVGTQTCFLPGSCTGWGSTWNFENILGDTNNSSEQLAWNYLATFQEAGFFWAEPGSEVTLESDKEIVYVANLLPSTVHQVKAWRTFEVSGIRQLTTVPTSYYSTRQSDFNGYTVTEVVLSQALSLRSEGWEDDIFVTQTSSVGPNPVDIMEWLITTYTSFTWDASFATIKTKVDKYPMNFMVPGRKNILSLLQEMAFQGRMALVLRDDEFNLTYLSDEPIEDGSIGESDVIANTLVIDHTDTEDLVTKLVAEWRPECHLDDPYKIILRFNVRKYGTQEETFDFYCYNIQELVIKSATFWLIRMANTWRKIICQTPINKLVLESLDGVFVTLPDVADGTIKCRVETATYNSADHAIDFVVQTPVRAGERTAFPFHYPADIDIDELHPTIEDIQFGNAGGSGPNVDVEAPQGHVLGNGQSLPQGFSFGQKSPCDPLTTNSSFTRPENISFKCRPDHGDQQPSDTDDTKPEVKIQDNTGSVPPGQSPGDTKSAADSQIIKNDFTQEGKNGGTTTRQTNNTGTGTGGTDGGGAGDNGGAGGGGIANPDADQQKSNMANQPSKEELEAQNKCHFTATITFFDAVTNVRIKNGESCNSPMENPCASANGWCFCQDPGKEGCVVGNQVLSTTESFHFDTAAERNAFVAAVQDMPDRKGTVGSSHPGFVTTEDYNPPGCNEASDPANPGIIGYDTDDSSQEVSIIGHQGFMTDSPAPLPLCINGIPQ